MSTGAKLFASAAQRNSEPILRTLEAVFSEHFGLSPLRLLEVASGTGQLSVCFASALPHVTFQPSECEERALNSITAYVQEAALPNLLPPLLLDVCKSSEEWKKGPIFDCPLDVILCVNMLHITPWSCSQALFRHAGSLLREDGLLVTYGPYAVDGVLTPDSNVKFHESLQRQDPSWGVRDIRDLSAEALAHGLQHTKTVDLPANNKILVFRRTGLN